jgi:hypothetical protein
MSESFLNDVEGKKLFYNKITKQIFLL